MSVNESPKVMRGGDQNIFERLSRYIPSEGEKQKREPREDFTTEALAYLLNASGTFCRRFVEKVLQVDCCGANYYEIITQKSLKGRRVDLIVRSAERNGIRREFGIEIKISSATPFGRGQIKAMGSNFGRGTAFLLAPELVLEKRKRELADHGVKGVRWGRVSRLLSDTSANGGEPNKTLMMQFQEYLNARGLSDVKLTKHPMKVKSIVDAARLMDEWTQILPAVWDALGFRRKSRTPKWDFANTMHKSSFYGIYGDEDAYAGFEITPSGDVLCYVERYALGRIPPNKQRSGGLLKLTSGDGKVCCEARRRFPDETEMTHEDIVRTFRELQDMALARLASCVVKSSRS